MIAHDVSTTVPAIDPGQFQAARSPTPDQARSPVLPRLDVLLGRRPDDPDDDPPPKAPRVFPGL